MKILFLSLADIMNLDGLDIYSALLKEFVKHGHTVDIISPQQKRTTVRQEVLSYPGYNIYKPRVGNITNTPFIEKGISIVLMRGIIIRFIRDKIGLKDYDLFIVATPPITADKVIRFVKKKTGAKAYLLLKDIWPDSINDLPVPGGEPVKKMVKFIFSRWERRLYHESDWIGCMSEANCRYIISHNKEIDARKIHINPNSIIPRDIKEMGVEERNEIRIKHNIPIDRVVFVYGGTLGVGQNVAYIVECLKACSESNCHFVISGKGVQFSLIEEYKDKYMPKNLTLINGLPKKDYDKLMQACDIGMVFLRYTAQTPNFPSKILTYMEYSIPILSSTDPVTDLNNVIENGKFGWGCLSNDASKFKETVERAISGDVKGFGENGRKYLEKEYNVNVSYNMIMNCFQGKMHQ